MQIEWGTEFDFEKLVEWSEKVGLTSVGHSASCYRAAKRVIVSKRYW